MKIRAQDGSKQSLSSIDINNVVTAIKILYFETVSELVNLWTVLTGKILQKLFNSESVSATSSKHFTEI